MPELITPILTPAPGFYIQEQNNVESSSGVGGPKIKANIVIVAERGPLNVATRINSEPEFRSIFGNKIQGTFAADSLNHVSYPGYDAVKKFFDMGGTEIWVTRIVHYTTGGSPVTTAAKAAVVLIDSDSPAGSSLDVEAPDEGAYGNSLRVTITANPIVSTSLSAATLSGATVLPLFDKPGGVVAGMDLRISEGANTEYVRVLAIDALGNMTVTKDASGLVGLSAVYTTAATVTSNEFDFILTQGGIELLRQRQIGMNPLLDNYITKVVKGPVVVTNISDNAIWLSKPADVTNSALSGGNDGLVGLTADDYVGNPVIHSGIYALDQESGAWDFSVPGQTSQTVVQAGLTYAQNRKTFYFFADMVPGLGYLAAQSERTTKGYDSGHGGFYYPWLGQTNVLTGLEEFTPPSIVGMATAQIQDTQLGPHKSPAGIQVAVVGVTRPAYRINMEQQKQLNPYGINVIMNVDGAGLRVWGARTLSSRQSRQWTSHRRWLNWFLASFIQESSDLVFSFGDKELYADWKRRADEKLQKEQDKRALEATADKPAFFTKCDEEVNTEATKKAGQVYQMIMVNQTNPAESFIVVIGQSQSSLSIQEQ